MVSDDFRMRGTTHCSAGQELGISWPEERLRGCGHRAKARFASVGVTRIREGSHGVGGLRRGVSFSGEMACVGRTRRFGRGV